MKTLKIASIYASALMLTAACSPESATLYSQRALQNETVEKPENKPIEQETLNWIVEDGGTGELNFNPQLDILFVTDNSDSMSNAQSNLAKNMNRFSKSILKNKMIDFNIGVVSVWDSSENFFELNKNGYQIGELRHVKDSNGKSYNKRYLTKDEAPLLASTLKIGTTSLDRGGPENEQVLSPLLAALEKSQPGDVNEGFFRPQSQLVVILLTDADDSSEITPESAAATLLKFKDNKKDKVSVYGVLVDKSDPDSVKDWSLRRHPKYHPECFTSEDSNSDVAEGCLKGFGPANLEKFISIANTGTPEQVKKDFIMKITSSSFGDDLARIGDQITAKTLRKEIFLSQRPKVGDDGKLMLRVSYGNQKIPQSERYGWLYNPDNNSVVLSGEIQYEYIEGARFTIEMVPLKLKSAP